MFDSRGPGPVSYSWVSLSRRSIGEIVAYLGGKEMGVIQPLAMILAEFTGGPIGTNAYLYGLEEGEAFLIDAPQGAAAWLEKELSSGGYEVVGLFLTHSHWDHIVDAAFISQKYDIPIYCHSDDWPNLLDPGMDGLPTPPGLHVPPLKEEWLRSLEDGEKWPVGDHELEVIHTPGHSPGSVCFYDRAEGILFTGDILFRGTVGFLHPPSVRKEVLWNSLKRLATLPAQTEVYPGHGEGTTLGEEAWIAAPEKKFG